MQSVVLNSKITALANALATANGLPPQLVRAHILQESQGNCYAVRFEPLYHYLWDNRKKAAFRPLSAAEIASSVPPADFSAPEGVITSHATEWIMQRSSWGPMQVMGAEAREEGFTGNISQLCDSDSSVGVALGCQLLKKLAAEWQPKLGWRAVSAAYNDGAARFLADGKTFVNQAYVDGIANYGGFVGLK